jgi:putative hemolysin
VVANHPFGLLEGLLLYSMLPGVRSDFRVMANAILHELPELRSHLIPLEVFGVRPEANGLAFRQAVRALAAGELVVLFPAGEVASFAWRRNAIEEPPWSRSAVWLAARTGAPVIPLHFSGSNSAWFQMAGLVHASLRTMRLPAELFNKRGTTIQLRTGAPIAARSLSSIGDGERQTEYLRERTLLLAHRGQARDGGAAAAEAPSCPDAAKEVAALDNRHRLASHGPYTAYLVRAREIPALLMEIGRRREETFRLVGEGTGSPTDIDTFDAHYEHLFIWQETKRDLVGAYRLTRTTPTIQRMGVEGLYTNTLFRYQPSFFGRLGNAVEVGRSFVRPAYQREFAPLLLLWRGLAQCALRYSPVLFGAVSVSNSYSPAARALIYEYLNRASALDPLRASVQARRPFAPQNGLCRSLAGKIGSMDVLSAAVADLEPDARGVPVLLRQYCKLGARALAFHVDRAFHNTLDCLVVADLRYSPVNSIRPFFPDREDLVRLSTTKPTQ